ncbi:hypothetical protein FQN54_005265 [Arachnomyces sp. PD_36]|nr:hypothetical protein FQN54_005265 [Arachnomyces sp. PD_36]
MEAPSISITEVQTLTADELIDCIKGHAPYSFTDADKSVMQKSSIAGRPLLHISRDQLKDTGLSLGAILVLLEFRDRVLENAPHGEANHKKIKPNNPYLSYVFESCRRRYDEVNYHFQRVFINEKNAKSRLSLPQISMDLPFPFLGATSPRRFDRSGPGGDVYHYMGREVFSDLVDTFMKCLDNRTVIKDMWVYGTAGNGKSHLLATLVYYLTAKGYRVVYIPDCGACCQYPVRYLQESLLFTWALEIEIVKEIESIDSMKDVQRFLHRHWEPSVVFVVDQINALNDQTEATENVRQWLERFMFESMNVLSTSGNDMVFLNTLGQQNNNKVFNVFGGFTSKEMDIWWDFHANIDLGGCSRAQVEDLTGRIPLLLDSCVAEGVMNLNSQEIQGVVGESCKFALKMKRDLPGVYWLTYRRYVDACIIESSVPGIEPEHVDHRFFYERNGIGYCASGIVRDSVVKGLAQVGVDIFPIEKCVGRMVRSTHEPAARYFMERAVLETVTKEGIPYIGLLGLMHQVFFDFQPIYDLEPSRAVYIPRYFKFPATAAAILKLDHSQRKAELLPIQITMDDSRIASKKSLPQSLAPLARRSGDLRGQR